MKPIIYIDRTTGKQAEEKVYGGSLLKLLYGRSWLSKIFWRPLNTLISKFPLFSFLFGSWQKLPATKRKIIPFIQHFHIDTAEFLDPVESFQTFNDFFIRKLKPEARPIAKGEDMASIPADGRYLFFQHFSQTDGFLVKGEKFQLEDLLQDDQLASEYHQGTMIIARLCPTDYHRFHFPVTCVPGKSHLINGYLFSVNPIAIKRDIHIFTKNKRMLCALQTDHFGKVLFMEIGATNVGSIHQTYTPHQLHQKGMEKGYFSFGASTLILLFEPNRLLLDQDLIEMSKRGMEIKCLMGQRMGRGRNANFRNRSAPQ